LNVWLRSPLPTPKVTNITQLTNNRERKFPPLVTDGTRLYFITPQKAGWSVAEVSAAGGEPVPISSHMEDTALADISPNGSELLIGTIDVASEVPLYILPLPPGLPRRVGDIVSHDASWSPDGEEIVYAHGNDLYVAKHDGSQSHLLVRLPGPADSPRWSPDGKVLRFTLNDLKSGTQALWEVASDGTRLRQVLPGWNDPPAECCGNWTPDGRYFVFVAQRVPNTSNLYALAEKGGLFSPRNPQPTQLTNGPTIIHGAVPSRDGKKLFAIGGDIRGELVRYDAKSGQFQPFLSGISAIQLSFSKDGQWVAYTSYPEGNLWRSKVDGSERLQLTFPPMGTMYPQWSPDGKQIVFAAQVPGKPSHIYMIPAEGGTARELTNGARDETFPSWSPDGNSLFFGNMPIPGGPPAITSRLDLKTMEVTTVPGSEGIWGLKLSPDGNFIAAVSESNHVVLLDLKAGKTTELSRLPTLHPVWSQDGRYVYFSTTLQGEPYYCRVRVKDGKMERFLTLKDVKRPTSGSFGSWTGLAPDDAPLALRDISTFEIYALDWQLP
jgi:Tol biopolymer transport system component